MKNAGFRLVVMVALTLCFFVNRGAAQAQDVDPIRDLAGLLVASSSASSEQDGKLYVSPADESAVLVSLHAFQIGPDKYQTSITGFPINFGILRAILPAFYLPPGDLICQNTTVKVYKNATCQTTITGAFQGCTPFGTNFATLTYFPTKKCKAGSGYCVEVKRALWTRNVYFDNLCGTFLYTQTGGDDFMCN
jgi:hypothetical protein